MSIQAWTNEDPKASELVDVSKLTAIMTGGGTTIALDDNPSSDQKWRQGVYRGSTGKGLEGCDQAVQYWTRQDQCVRPSVQVFWAQSIGTNRLCRLYSLACYKTSHVSPRKLEIESQKGFTSWSIAYAPDPQLLEFPSISARLIQLY